MQVWVHYLFPYFHLDIIIHPDNRRHQVSSIAHCAGIARRTGEWTGAVVEGRSSKNETTVIGYDQRAIYAAIHADSR